MLLIDKNGYYLYKPDRIFLNMSFSCKAVMSIMVFLIWILLLLAALVSGKRKTAVSLFMRIIVATRIRHKAFGADNRGASVRLKERSFESRINRLMVVLAI